jgi:23S rRNA (uridine2552-2'-O)-methyltransferase
MHADNWANKAKQMGYRSRAVFKLEEILQKFDSKKRYQNVLDLGSSPGGWSQYIKKKYNSSMVFAIDILDMEPIDGVNFYQESIECIDKYSRNKEIKRLI